jgi:hypothetical protein
VQPDARRCRSTFDGRGAALALWRQARPIDGSLAARYLAAREISGSWDALRFHPRVPLGRGTGAIWRPALLSGVSDDDGFCAVQRSFLDPSGLSLATDIDPARRMLGVPRKGAVRLARPRHCLGLAEGIESALSAMLRFKIAVWATTGAERLDHISIPDCISTLVLFPDNDLAGRRSEARAFAAYARDGRRILTRPPPTGFSDWNDVAQQEGRERGGVRLAD